MPKYIEVDMLADMIEAKANTLVEGKEAFLYMCKWLDYLPAADVAEVKHAEWKWGTQNGQYGIYCTNCGAGWVDSENCELIAHSHKYCPKCGAQMGRKPREETGDRATQEFKAQTGITLSAMQKTRCRSCGAVITWIKTPSGKSMPCDTSPVYYRKTAAGKDKVVTPTGDTVSCEIVQIPDIADGIGYIPHWSTCDNPDKFRKDKSR